MSYPSNVAFCSSCNTQQYHKETGHEDWHPGLECIVCGERQNLKPKRSYFGILTIIIALIFGIVAVMGIGSAIGTYPAVDPSMVLYYHFNNNSAIGENTSYFVDSSNSGNNATLLGGTLNSTLNLTCNLLNDGCIQFYNITGAYMSVTNGFNSTFNVSAPFSISFWVKSFNGNSSYVETRSFLGERGVGSGSNQGAFFQGHTQRIEFIVGNITAVGTTGTSSNNNVFDNNWHNIVGIYDGTNTILYQDGVPITTKIVGLVPARADRNFEIGRDSRSANFYFNGSFDEVIVYNKSLSAQEVATNYINYAYQLGIQNITSCGFYTGNFQTFRLIQDITNTSNCLDIRDSYYSTLDGNGYNLTYANTLNNTYCSSVNSCIGINARANNYLTIKNINIRGIDNPGRNAYGIYLLFSNYSTVYNTTINTGIQTGAGYGIRVSGSNDINISYNSIITGSGDGYGILFEWSNSNREYISFNNISTGTVAGRTAECISFYGVTNSTLRNNTLYNAYGNALRIDGTEYAHYYNSIDTSNLADYKPINYSYNLSNLDLNGIDYTPYGLVFFGFSNNITIRNSNFSTDGLVLSDISNFNITNNNFDTNNGQNIYLEYSNVTNYIYNNNLITRGYRLWPIVVAVASKVLINNNNITTYNYSADGINLYLLNDSTFTNNNINVYGENSSGFLNFYSNNNIFQNNYISINRSSYGVGINSQQGSGNNSIYYQSTFDIYFLNNNIGNITNYVYNITNALIYTSNGSVPLACQTISACDGNVNISLTPGNYSYVLENYNKTEGVTRANDPIGLTQTNDVTYTITSSIVPINVTTILNHDCDTAGDITYGSQTIARGTYTCSDDTIEITLENIPTGSSLLLVANSQALVESCTGILSGLEEFGSFLPLLIVVLIGGVAIVFVMGSADENTIDDTEDSSFGFIVAIIIVAMGSAIVFAVVNGAC